MILYLFYRPRSTARRENAKFTSVVRLTRTAQLRLDLALVTSGQASRYPRQVSENPNRASSEARNRSQSTDWKETRKRAKSVATGSIRSLAPDGNRSTLDSPGATRSSRIPRLVATMGLTRTSVPPQESNNQQSLSLGSC